MPQSYPDFYDPFVTVVSVGADEKPIKPLLDKVNMINSEFVTVLTIGNEENKSIKDVTEEVVVYRLPGERLGFGLKFEGGTKAHEFVKRLLIQSCAPNSPASRVQSSWGQLVEGDEVLKIDCMPVNSMTRIDCVRFLKDSNVAIKLLVKHSFKNNKNNNCDTPVIVSEEKKPPPVPPRKIHRKLQKTLQGLENIQDNNIVPKINNQQESFLTKSARLQSPRNSGRKKYSPDFARKISDGSLGPPDAEVYLDLFSQDSTQSLSESDDTGSTISTVLDRFASFPTTTTSSFAGSLPSTPTSIQKKLDLSYVNDFDDLLDRKCIVEENNNIINHLDEGITKFLEEEHTSCNGDDLLLDETDFRQELPKRPSVAPRSRDKINKQSISDDAEPTLPRLVDFVPKSPNKEASMDTLKRFLESERFDFNYPAMDNIDDSELDFIANGMDLYGSKWMISSHLSTIGEDEEECRDEFTSNYGTLDYTPQVTIENIEVKNDKYDELSCSDKEEDVFTSFVNDNEERDILTENQDLMEIPPSDSRQPPDGHEFPDFIEKLTVPKDSAFNEETEVHRSSFNFTWNELKPITLDRSLSNSNCDLRPLEMRQSDDEQLEPQASNLLHTRSQSLIDMSIFSKEKNKWSAMAEQRKRRLSKLKGLVIPEATENETTLCDIPEIKSSTPAINLPILPNINPNKTFKNGFDHSHKPAPLDEIKPIVLPSWTTNTTIPKYSPAFKRKSLQVYPVKKSESTELSSYDEYIHNNSSPPRSSSNDDPKSLESIASPTRSDCSFDYMTRKPSKNLNGTYDESDNDSAVSSSQSSYNSRCSPPLSPVCDNSQNRLVLKPSSVEAINRKNILQSARCSSGKDIKIGSPVIQRKYDEEENQNQVKEEDVKVNYTTTVTVQTSTLVVSNVGDRNDEPKKVEEQTTERRMTVKPPSPPTIAPPIPKERTHLPVEKVQINDTKKVSETWLEKKINSEPKVTERTFKTESKVEIEPVTPRTSIAESKNPKISCLIEKVENTGRSERSLSLEESKFNSDMLAARAERYSTGSILDKRNKPQPISVKNMMKNFENVQNSTPVFPKNFKIESKNTLAQKAVFEPVKPTLPRRQLSQNGSEKIQRSVLHEKIISRQTSEERSVKREPLRRASLINGVKENLNGSKEDNFSSSSLHTVELTLNNSGTSLGITLAGGIDYDTKIITIHRIRYGSIAYQDGRLKKGDKIISINGHSTEGLTHEAATELLKKSCKKFSIVVEDTNDIIPSSSMSNLSRRSSSSMTSLSSESTKGALDDLNASVNAKEPNQTVCLIKDGGGLSFSIEGGKDSPKGDVPLVVKKIFAGGAAEKSGKLQPGDEILCVNGINFQNLSRLEAWNILKKTPEGEVKIEIFR